MFTWQFSETVETQAKAENIWKYWSQPDTWNVWDSDVKSAFIEGDFVQDVKDVMIPASGQKVVFRLSQVEINNSFTNTSKLPLATIDFYHTFIPSTDEKPAKIVHGVKISGLLAPFFGMVIGRNVKKNLRTAMITLSQLATR